MSKSAAQDNGIHNECRSRHRLLARIARRYDVVQRKLTIDKLRLNFAQVRDPDRVLDRVVAEADRREKLAGGQLPDDDLHLPYWAELWDSALAVGEYLCANHSALSTQHSALDLGCGLGLAGTVAAALGHRVMLADMEPDALLFARLNCAPFAPRVRCRRVDWRRDRLNERFDLILGADVLYDKTQWEFLDAFWRAHLCGENGASVILGEPGRQTGDLFVNWIASRNWRLEQTLVQVPTREKPLRVFRLFR
jgi:predicted nicotinamide N-methyase